ncbi:hypothetical protein BDB00DRAFT_964455 [Zychaea mexicana]|uniref:uncharacterized protein n=1 Tax=Zychaea mexicana TaxID=64656 RepID=UPI0022FDBF4E|nr:uncharacterized protein BDB00DRAFT_964455 [Zychaea mexicana]KAI9487932.1 hypothetical protein BDB00DRAFT_964455 [Zychaea mexicana]
METRPLYGGAISCAVANSFLDASQVRQIPDNQEVFVDTETQQSLIIELLEPVEAEDERIARLHFEQLARDNEAAATEILKLERIPTETATPRLPPSTTNVHVLRGNQKVAKFDEAKKMAFNTVQIMMAVVRLQQVSTDLVISINAPVLIASGSSDQQQQQQESTTVLDVEKHMQEVLSELKVNDWSLFG